MSQTERSGLFTPIHLDEEQQRNSIASSTLRKKGISLSKSLKRKSREKSPSFIRLSGRASKPSMIEKREIRLLIKGKELFAGQSNLILQEKENHHNRINQIQMPNTYRDNRQCKMVLLGNNHFMEAVQTKICLDSLPAKKSTALSKPNLNPDLHKFPSRPASKRNTLKLL